MSKQTPAGATGAATTRPRYVILISGRGSNMQSLVTADLPGTCVAVISNRPGAEGLAWAAEQGIPVRVLDHRGFADRAAFDAALAALIDELAADWVFLAGFMRILGEPFVRHYAGRLINIHPSLLPAFPGLDTHGQALAAGVRVHGATVHFVVPALDAGPAIAQAVVPVHHDDDVAALAARVLVQEHQLYPRAARWLLQGQVWLADGRACYDAVPVADAALCSPGP